MNSNDKYNQDRESFEETEDLARDFEKTLFITVNAYVKKGLKKPDLIKKLEWVTVSAKFS